MWQHDDLFVATGSGGSALRGIPTIETVAEAGTNAASRPDGPVVLLACPLMHATALSNAYGALSDRWHGGSATR